MKIAIMQPTFMPWLGYFAMIKEVDKFVILDHVQFNRRSWQQRNQILNNKIAKWLSVPVYQKGNYEEKIKNIKINYTQHFPQKILNQIYEAYKNTKYFNFFYEYLENIFKKEFIFLCDFNSYFIKSISKELSYNTEFIYSSDLDLIGSKDKLIFNICKKLNATVYLSPEGSKNYLDQSNYFIESNINLTYHTYKHPKYNQISASFISHLSIIDLIFNEGFSEAAKII